MNSIPRRPLTAADVYHFTHITDVQISPAGNLIAYVLRSVPQQRNSYRSAIWLMNPETGETHQLTAGTDYDAQPRWSPDGTSLAFTSGGTIAPPLPRGNPRNLYLVDIAAGGIIRQLTHFDDDIALEVTYPIISEAYAWAPAGDEICFSMKEPWPDGDGAPPAYVYDRLRYKSGELGWWDGRRKHLWVIEISSGNIRQLTSGDWDAYGPAYSPDGAWIAFSSSRAFTHERVNTLPDTNPFAPKDVWTISAGGGTPHRLTGANGPNMTPSFSPDGQRVAYFGHEVPNGAWGYNIHLWVRCLGGSSPALDVLAQWDHTAGSHVMSDIHDVYAPPPAQWSPDGSLLYFQGTVRGAANIFRVPTDGGMPKTVTEGDHEVVLASLDRSCTRLAAIISDDTTPGDLYFGPTGGELRRMTDVNRQILASCRTVRAERVNYLSADGREIDTFVMKPPDFDPARRYPMVLELFPSFVHGRAFNHEFQMLAGAGYVVVFANPRGATSYGEEFLRDSFVRGQYFADFDDVMECVDFIVGLGYVDPGRMAVTGDAYGGTLTNWIITQTDRFAASVSRRGAANLWIHTGDRSLGAAEADPAHYSIIAPTQHPIGYAAKVSTPHLMIHSIGDCRTAIAEAEEFFVALRSLGKVARLIAFGNATHFLSRMGTPRDREAFFVHILDWLDQHIGRHSTERPGETRAVHAGTGAHDAAGGGIPVEGERMTADGSARGGPAEGA